MRYGINPMTPPFLTLEMADMPHRSLVVVEGLHSTSPPIPCKVLQVSLWCVVVTVTADLAGQDVPLPDGGGTDKPYV